MKKKCSLSSVIRETQIKLHWDLCHPSQNGYHAKKEKDTERESMREREHISTCWWGCGTLYIAGENVSSLSAMEISMQSCQKPEVVLPYNNDIVMPFLDMYLKDSKSSCHIESYILCFNNIHKSKLCYQPTGLKTNEWAKNVGVYIYTNSFILP